MADLGRRAEGLRAEPAPDGVCGLVRAAGDGAEPVSDRTARWRPHRLRRARAEGHPGHLRRDRLRARADVSSPRAGWSGRRWSSRCSSSSVRGIRRPSTSTCRSTAARPASRRSSRSPSSSSASRRRRSKSFSCCRTLSIRRTLAPASRSPRPRPTGVELVVTSPKRIDVDRDAALQVRHRGDRLLQRLPHRRCAWCLSGRSARGIRRAACRAAPAPGPSTRKAPAPACPRTRAARSAASSIARPKAGARTIALIRLTTGG